MEGDRCFLEGRCKNESNSFAHTSVAVFVRVASCAANDLVLWLAEAFGFLNSKQVDRVVLHKGNDSDFLDILFECGHVPCCAFDRDRGRGCG